MPECTHCGAEFPVTEGVCYEGLGRLCDTCHARLKGTEAA